MDFEIFGCFSVIIRLLFAGFGILFIICIPICIIFYICNFLQNYYWDLQKAKKEQIRKQRLEELTREYTIEEALAKGVIKKIK